MILGAFDIIWLLILLFLALLASYLLLRHGSRSIPLVIFIVGLFVSYVGQAYLQVDQVRLGYIIYIPAVFFALIAFYLQNKKQFHHVEIIFPPRLELLMAALAIGVGIFFKLYKVTTLPASPGTEECVHGMHALWVLDYGWRYPIQVQGVTWSIGIYIWALSLHLLGVSLFNLRLPIIILNMVALFLYYFTFRRLFNNRVAFVACTLFSIMLWNNAITRVPQKECFVPFFTIASLFFLVRAIDMNKLLDYILASLFIVLGNYTFQGFRTADLMLAAAFMYSVVFKKRYFRCNWWRIVVMLIAMAAFFYPFIKLKGIVYLLPDHGVAVMGEHTSEQKMKESALFALQMYNYKVFGQQPFNYTDRRYKDTILQWGRDLGNILINKTQYTSNKTMRWILATLGQASRALVLRPNKVDIMNIYLKVFFTFGWILCLIRFTRHGYGFCFTYLLFGTLGAMVLEGILRRFNAIQVIIPVMSAIGLDWGLCALAKLKRGGWRRRYATFALILLAVFSMSNFYIYKVHILQHYNLMGWVDLIVDYFKRDFKDYDMVPRTGTPDYMSFLTWEVTRNLDYYLHPELAWEQVFPPHHKYFKPYKGVAYIFDYQNINFREFNMVMQYCPNTTFKVLKDGNKPIHLVLKVPRGDLDRIFGLNTCFYRSRSDLNQDLAFKRGNYFRAKDFELIGDVNLSFPVYCKWEGSILVSKGDEYHVCIDSEGFGELYIDDHLMYKQGADNQVKFIEKQYLLKGLHKLVILDEISHKNDRVELSWWISEHHYYRTPRKVDDFRILTVSAEGNPLSAPKVNTRLPKAKLLTHKKGILSDYLERANTSELNMVADRWDNLYIFNHNSHYPLQITANYELNPIRKEGYSKTLSKIFDVEFDSSGRILIVSWDKFSALISKQESSTLLRLFDQDLNLLREEDVFVWYVDGALDSQNNLWVRTGYPEHLYLSKFNDRLLHVKEWSFKHLVNHQLTHISRMDIDSDDIIYLLDIKNNLVAKCDLNMTYRGSIRTIDYDEQGYYILKVDQLGNIFILQPAKNYVHLYSPNGEVHMRKMEQIPFDIDGLDTSGMKPLMIAPGPKGIYHILTDTGDIIKIKAYWFPYPVRGID